METSLGRDPREGRGGMGIGLRPARRGRAGPEPPPLRAAPTCCSLTTPVLCPSGPRCSKASTTKPRPVPREPSTPGWPACCGRPPAPPVSLRGHRPRGRPSSEKAAASLRAGLRVLCHLGFYLSLPKLQEGLCGSGDKTRTRFISALSVCAGLR